jgi:hypothetical protein
MQKALPPAWSTKLEARRHREDKNQEENVAAFLFGEPFDKLRVNPRAKNPAPVSWRNAGRGRSSDFPSKGNTAIDIFSSFSIYGSMKPLRDF